MAVLTAWSFALGCLNAEPRTRCSNPRVKLGVDEKIRTFFSSLFAVSGLRIVVMAFIVGLGAGGGASGIEAVNVADDATDDGDATGSTSGGGLEGVLGGGTEVFVCSTLGVGTSDEDFEDSVAKDLEDCMLAQVDQRRRRTPSSTIYV